MFTAGVSVCMRFFVFRSNEMTNGSFESPFHSECVNISLFLGKYCAILLWFV